MARKAAKRGAKKSKADDAPVPPAVAAKNEPNSALEEPSNDASKPRYESNASVGKASVTTCIEPAVSGQLT